MRLPAAFAPLALLLPLALPGCTSCAPVEVPTVIGLGLEDEETRTLPILASGETRIAGEEIPDAHGQIELLLTITHPGVTNETLKFNSIRIRGLGLVVEVDGLTVPVEILKVEGTGSWTRETANRWNGAGHNNTRIVVWWAVDFEPARAPLSIALREGAPYTAAISFDWTYRDCFAFASGTHREEIADFVQSSVNARTFAPLVAPKIETVGAGVGLTADFTITSGHNATIGTIEARALRYGAPAAEADAVGIGASTLEAEVEIAAPTLSLVAFPRIATLVDGSPSREIAPTQTLRIQSAALASDAYATSGTLVPPATGDRAAYVLTVSIAYTLDDPTVGMTTDTFAFAILEPVTSS